MSIVFDFATGIALCMDHAHPEVRGSEQVKQAVQEVRRHHPRTSRSFAANAAGWAA